jgi:hypothetical protein
VLKSESGSEEVEVEEVGLTSRADGSASGGGRSMDPTTFGGGVYGGCARSHPAATNVDGMLIRGCKSCGW